MSVLGMQGRSRFWAVRTATHLEPRVAKVSILHQNGMTVKRFKMECIMKEKGNSKIQKKRVVKHGLAYSHWIFAEYPSTCSVSDQKLLHSVECLNLVKIARLLIARHFCLAD